MGGADCPAPLFHVKHSEDTIFWIQTIKHLYYILKVLFPNLLFKAERGPMP